MAGWLPLAAPAAPAAGFLINIIWGPHAASSSNFQAGVVNACNQYMAVITNPITINLNFDLGFCNGNAVPANAQETQSVGWGVPNYSVIQSAMVAKMTTTTGAAYAATMPVSSGLDGFSAFTVNYPAARALGFAPASDATTDAFIGLGTDFDTSGPAFSIMVGGLLHEISHAMGRVQLSAPYTFGRWTSSAARSYFGGGYLSVDGGVTPLATYDVSGVDPDGGTSYQVAGIQGDFDPFCVTINPSRTINTLTTVDLKQMVAQGFNVLGV